MVRVFLGRRRLEGMGRHPRAFCKGLLARRHRLKRPNAEKKYGFYEHGVEIQVTCVHGKLVFFS